MYPSTISSVERPRSIDEVLTLLSASRQEFICIAGGMSLMQAIKARMVRPDGLVDLADIDELKGVSRSHGALRVGAMTRYLAIAASAEIGPVHAALKDAAARVGDRQVRHRGTIGGSLCWNYVLACMPTVAISLDAEMELASISSGARVSRRIPVREFLVSPLETARGAEELLVAVHFPAPARSGSAYRKWGPGTDSLPSVGVAVSVTLDASGSCRSARVAMTGFGDGPQLFSEAAKALIGKQAGDDAAIEAAIDMAVENADFLADSWGSTAYKQMRARSIGAEIIKLAFGRAQEQ